MCLKTGNEIGRPQRVWKIIGKYIKHSKNFRSEPHNVKEKVNKIALSVIDDKRLQAPDGVTTYSYGYKC